MVIGEADVDHRKIIVTIIRMVIDHWSRISTGCKTQLPLPTLSPSYHYFYQWYNHQEPSTVKEQHWLYKSSQQDPWHLQNHQMTKMIKITKRIKIIKISKLSKSSKGSQWSQWSQWSLQSPFLWTPSSGWSRGSTGCPRPTASLGSSTDKFSYCTQVEEQPSS